MPAPGEFTIIVQAAENQIRLDALVALRVPELSRSHAAHLIRGGDITVDGKTLKAGHRVKAGETISGRIPAPASLELVATAMGLDVLYEDEDLIVVNKPAGLVVHPAAGHADDTLVNALLHHCPDLSGIGGKARPGIVHRLDKDTTGVLVVAKNDPAQISLAQQFNRRQVSKTYYAVVRGAVAEDQGRIDLPIGRHPSDRKKMSTVTRKGRSALTLWRVKERLRGASVLEIDLKTGRTHQIRVHCAAMGHPVLGDPVYGRSRGMHRLSAGDPELYRVMMDIKRQLLHAACLGFSHPADGRPLVFRAELPLDMVDVIHALRRMS